MAIKERLNETKEELKKYPKWLVEKYYKIIREKAIQRVQKELKLRQKNTEDFDDNELEALIAEEEKEVMKNHKMGSMQALLIVLGINIF